MHRGQNALILWEASEVTEGQRFDCFESRYQTQQSAGSAPRAVPGGRGLGPDVLRRGQSTSCEAKPRSQAARWGWWDRSALPIPAPPALPWSRVYPGRNPTGSAAAACGKRPVHPASLYSYHLIQEQREGNRCWRGYRGAFSGTLD